MILYSCTLYLAHATCSCSTETNTFPTSVAVLHDLNTPVPDACMTARL